MTRSASITVLGVAALVASAGLNAATIPLSPAFPAPAVSGIGEGTAIVRVLHERTGSPLGDIRVFVTPLEGASFVLSQATNADGEAVFKGMEGGDYMAFITHNNQSAAAKFTVLSGPDEPVVVVIAFNPDIDN